MGVDRWSQFQWRGYWAWVSFHRTTSLPLSHKLRVYKEYHSVCPLGVGPFQPLSRQRVRPSPRTRGGHTRLRVRGWGSSNSDEWRKKLNTLPTLCSLSSLPDTEDSPPPSGYVPSLRTGGEEGQEGGGGGGGGQGSIEEVSQLPILKWLAALPLSIFFYGGGNHGSSLSSHVWCIIVAACIYQVAN